MTPALADNAPEGSNWIHELKYDGYRTQLALSRGDRHAYTRRGHEGIHVVLPFAPAEEWPEVRAFARRFCAALAEAAPDLYTVALPKAQRRGRIFLDYLRNQRTATAVMPYSARAKRGSSVAAPVDWKELDGISCADAFSIADTGTLVRRVRTLRQWGLSDQRLP